MQRLPPFSVAHKFPVTAVLGAGAIAASLAWWGKVDVTPLFESFEWPHQPWRLFTSALLHVNAIHLVFNLYWLWGFGTLLERRFGPLKIALIYVLLATVSGAAEFAFLEGGVGLSGVVYGLFGLLFVLAKYDRVYAQVIDPQTVQLFVGWFFICIVTTLLKIMPVGNVAHGVGALVGYLLGLAIVSSSNRRHILSGALALLTVLSFSLASVGREYVNLSGDASFDYWQRGIDAFKKGDSEAALTYFKRAVAIKSTSGELWYNLGLAHERLNQSEQAVEAYQRALQLAPDDRETIDALVGQYEILGDKANLNKDWATAEHYYIALLRLDDSQADMWYNLANVYKHEGKITDAIQALQNAISHSPDESYRAMLDSLKKAATPPKK